MVGYHYTTREIYDSVIAKAGLTLAPAHPRHIAEFAEVEKYTREGVIWLYKLPQWGRPLIGMIIYVAAEHGSERVCLLEVQYEEDHATSILAARQIGSNEIVKLTHNLSVGACGYFGHQREPIELLNQPVPPERIRLTTEWDLNDLIRRR